MRERNLAHSFVLAACLILGAYLRFYAIDFGLPHKFRPDEEFLVDAALIVLNGNLNPSFYLYPHLPINLLAGIYFIMGFFTDSDLQEALSKNYYSLAYLSARYVSAIASVFTIFLTYKLGKVLMNSAVGLLSSCFYSVNFISVREAHFAKHDSIAMFFIVLSLILLAHYRKSKKTNNYFFIGASIGFAISCQYYAGLLLISMFTLFCEMYILEAKRVTFYDILICISATIVVFFVSSPSMLFNLVDTVNAFMMTLGFEASAPSWQIAESGWLWYIGKAAPMSSGWPLLALSFLGFCTWIMGSFSKEESASSSKWFLLSFVIAHAVFFSLGARVVYRYFLFVTPIYCVAAAYGCYYLYIKTYEYRTLRLCVLSIVSLSVLIDNASRCFSFNSILSEMDTRELAVNWIANNIPADQKIGTLPPVMLKPVLPVGREFFNLTTFLNKNNLEDLSSCPDCTWFYFETSPLLSYAGPLNLGLQEYLELNTELVASFNPKSIEQRELPQYDPVDAFFVPFNNFSSIIRPGPKIQIFERTK